MVPMRSRVRAVLPLPPAAAFPLLVVAFLLAALTFAVTPAPASDLCGDDEHDGSINFDNGRGVTVRDVQESHEPAPSGIWRIECGQTGSVKITDWNKSEVYICARVTAWARNRQSAERILRQVSVSNSGGMLHADGPAQTNNARWGVLFRIHAPRSTDLDVQAMNGGISVRGIHGRMSLHTENGPLEVVDAGGDVEGRTTNGPIAVTLTGSRWNGRGLDCETSNGPISLMIPDGYSAELTTGTTNGPMVGAYVSGRSRRHGPVTQVIGKGGPPIRVITTNGPVAVNQVVDGEDADDEGDSSD